MKGTGQNVAAALEVFRRGRTTGIMHVASEKGNATIGFHNGDLVFASSEGGTRLGEMLVEMGLVEQNTLEAALRMQRRKKSPQFLGTLLTDLGLVSKEAAALAIEAQALRVLQHIVDAQECFCTFESTDQDWEGTVLPEMRDVNQYLLKVALAAEGAAALE